EHRAAGLSAIHRAHLHRRCRADSHGGGFAGGRRCFSAFRRHSDGGHGGVARHGRYAYADALPLLRVLADGAAAGRVALLPEALGAVGIVGRIERFAYFNRDAFADVLEAAVAHTAGVNKARRLEFAERTQRPRRRFGGSYIL